MEYTLETVGLLQLDEYVAEIAAIYKRNDIYRSLWDVWCHTLHNAAGIAERIRKGQTSGRLMDEIADFSLWLFTFVRKLSEGAAPDKVGNAIGSDAVIRIENACSDLLWQRYPGICPFCLARRSKAGATSEQELRRPCECSCAKYDATQSKQEKRAAAEVVRAFSRHHFSEKPRSIDEWQKMFVTVFQTNLSQTSPQQAVLHMLEELGETSDAMARTYSYKKSEFVHGEPHQRRLRLESQLADVFSWLFTVVETLNRERCPKNDDATLPTCLSQIIWRRYGSDSLRSLYCRFCERRECECTLIVVPTTRSMEEFDSLNTSLPSN
jgi:NTP pyrophosphatase (non-canonical NTP hydrolase)